MSSLIDIALLHSDEARFASLADHLETHCSDIAVGVSTTQWSELVHGRDLAETIVILDAQFADTAPVLDRVRQLRALGARVILLDGDNSPSFVLKAMGAGADASLGKRDSPRTVMHQIRLAANRARLIKQRASA